MSLDLFVGAVIGLLGSTIGSIFIHGYQTRREIRTVLFLRALPHLREVISPSDHAFRAVRDEVETIERQVAMLSRAERMLVEGVENALSDREASWHAHRQQSNAGAPTEEVANLVTEFDDKVTAFERHLHKKLQSWGQRLSRD